MTIERSPGLQSLKDEVTTLHKGVPYYSQSLDTLDKNGNIDTYWFRRACGVVCVKMALDYLVPDKAKKSVVELAEEGRFAGGILHLGGVTTTSYLFSRSMVLKLFVKKIWSIKRA